MTTKLLTVEEQREDILSRIREIEATRDAGGLWVPRALASLKAQLRQLEPQEITVH